MSISLKNLHRYSRERAFRSFSKLCLKWQYQRASALQRWRAAQVDRAAISKSCGAARDVLKLAPQLASTNGFIFSHPFCLQRQQCVLRFCASKSISMCFCFELFPTWRFDFLNFYLQRSELCRDLLTSLEWCSMSKFRNITFWMTWHDMVWYDICMTKSGDGQI